MALSPSHLLKLASLALVYAFVARASLTLDAIHGFATLVWPPTGLALWAAIRLGYWVWPGVALGAFAANLWQGAPVAAAAGIAAGNALEAVLGAYLLRRVGFRAKFDQLSDVAAFVGLGALAAPVVSATIGPASLAGAGVIPVHHLFETSLAWWIGDSCGALVVGSMLLAWTSDGWRPPTSDRALEVVVLSLLLLLAALAPMADPVLSRSVPFLVFPLLIWTTVRFGPRGATAAAALASAAAVACTALGYGPFAQGRLQERLWTMQAYMAIIVITLLVLGAVTEERARAVDALRRELDAREEFLSIASHELKTPLSTIVLSLSGLQRAFRRGEQTATEGVIRKVDRSVKQADRLVTLIDQLLDVSRISGGKLELLTEDVDLCDLAREVCGRFSEEAARSGSTLSIQGARSLPGRWDRLRIEQVLSNLLSNALRYGEGRPIDVCLEERGSMATMAVRDRGRGIAAEALPGVFDRFASSQGARRFGGLGLGLYIARQIVEEHRGAIHATSTLGEGSTFTVVLPLVKAAREPSGSTSRIDRDREETEEGEGNRASARHDSR